MQPHGRTAVLQDGAQASQKPLLLGRATNVTDNRVAGLARA